MLIHTHPTPEAPVRVVVIGASGFIGGAIADKARSRGVEVLPINRSDVDLLEPDASLELAARLRPEDSVVAAAAIAPVKTPTQLADNIRLIETIEKAVAARPVAHFLNISSDAIYGETSNAITEASRREPRSLHGVMHYVRELQLREAVGQGAFATLRPTLVYGEKDPHNGYGPNRFRREAAAGSPIRIFGEGEEQRDHVDILDVADLAMRILTHKSRGALNAATGEVRSFRDIAEIVAAHYGAAIESVPRQGPMPHNGYRAFDASATRDAFPDFEYRALPDGLARVHEALAA